MAAPILWAPGKQCALSAGKNHVHKIPRVGGGVILGFGGGGKCRFYLYGREDFSDRSSPVNFIDFCRKFGGNFAGFFRTHRTTVQQIRENFGAFFIRNFVAHKTFFGPTSFLRRATPQNKFTLFDVFCPARGMSKRVENYFDTFFGGAQKRGFQKGGFGGCSPGTKTGTRVRSDVPPQRKTGTRVRSHVPSERKPERGLRP